jgi:protein gp88
VKRRVRLPVVIAHEPAGAIVHLRDHDQPWDPRCVACRRPRSAHGTPIQVGGESFVPACELLHPGGLIPEGPPPPPGPRPMAKRLKIARSMPLIKARAIAGSLGEPSKMPGPSYGLDAFVCQKGSELAAIPGSSCEHCYARRNFYKYWRPALKARHHRQAAIHHPEWVEAMIAILEDYLKTDGEKVFRWHDSGDLHSADHLANICAVAEATPGLAHWLPTREYDYVATYRARGGVIPPNLTIRLSAHFVGRVADVPLALADLPTSTIHPPEGTPVPVSGRRNDSVSCRAFSRDNHCGPCRACWDQRVRNVSYPQH